MLALLGSGFLLGWSVAWPPGPINAEVARRCLSGGFWAGFGVILGACSGDAAWALLVALGIGTVFTTPTAQLVLGVISLALLAMLAVTFLRRARAAWLGQGTAPVERFESGKASFLLGLTMALTSPWNVTFWLAAIGRPGMNAIGLAGLLTVVVAVMAGAAAWGVVWCAVVLFTRSRAGDGSARWGAVVMNGATAALLIWFFVGAALRVFA